MPKRGVNMHENEVARAYKTVNDRIGWPWKSWEELPPCHPAIRTKTWQGSLRQWEGRLLSCPSVA
jgi:hypothetical protein